MELAQCFAAETIGCVCDVAMPRRFRCLFGDRLTRLAGLDAQRPLPATRHSFRAERLPRMAIQRIGFVASRHTRFDSNQNLFGTWASCPRAPCSGGSAVRQARPAALASQFPSGLVGVLAKDPENVSRSKLLAQLLGWHSPHVLEFPAGNSSSSWRLAGHQ